MGEHLLKVVIHSLKLFLEFEHTYRKGRVFIEDEREVVENTLDLFVRIQKRTVGPFGEDS